MNAIRRKWARWQKQPREGGGRGSTRTHAYMQATNIAMRSKMYVPVSSVFVAQQHDRHNHTLTLTHTHIHICIHADRHAYIHTYIHTWMNTYIHACIQTYMHTYIHNTCKHT